MLENQKAKLALICGSVLLCGAMAWFGGAGSLPGSEDRAEPDIARTGSVVTETRRDGTRNPDARAVQVTVFVSGAAPQPGLYTVAKGTRAREACKDGTHIRVPRLSQRRLKELRQMKKAAPEGRLRG